MMTRKDVMMSLVIVAVTLVAMVVIETTRVPCLTAFQADYGVTVGSSCPDAAVVSESCRTDHVPCGQPVLIPGLPTQPIPSMHGVVRFSCPGQEEDYNCSGTGWKTDTSEPANGELYYTVSGQYTCSGWLKYGPCDYKPFWGFQNGVQFDTGGTCSGSLGPQQSCSGKKLPGLGSC